MKSLIALLFVFVLVGCGHTKKVTESGTKTEINTSTDALTETATKSVEKVDKSVTTVITERVDTSVRIPSATASVSRPLTEFLDKGVIEASNGNTSVSVWYDPTTGTVLAEGKTAEHRVPIYAVKTTVAREDSKYSEVTKTDEKKSVSNDLTAKTETENKVVETKTPAKVIAWLWLIILVVLGIFILIQYYRPVR